MLWSKSKHSAAAAPAPHRLTGVEVNACRIVAVSAAGQAQVLPLGAHADELPLIVNLESKAVGPGPTRRYPHLYCSNFLPQLGQPREWRGPKHRLTPEAALQIAFEAIANKLPGPLVMTLPDYLSIQQVQAVQVVASRAKLTLRATISASLAVASHRAEMVMNAPPVKEVKPDWVVPLRPEGKGPGVVMIIDCDSGALTATAYGICDKETRLLNSAHWPQFANRFWKDRLLDAVADRCIRLCRRDPRDSAEAEQMLFDAIEPALAQARKGASVMLTARADKWYQDLTMTPADFEAATAPLLKAAKKELSDALTSLALPSPPRAVWLTRSASQLPGLATELYELCPEGTEVAVLPPFAAAEAACALEARIRAGEVSAGHHDAVLPAMVKPVILEAAPVAKARIS